MGMSHLLLLGLGTGIWLWLGAENPARGQRPAIAVLTFVTFAADEATTRLANGLTEDIISDLARQTGIDVIARASTEVYKGRSTDVRQIGRDLNVRFVLEGSIQRDGDQIRATARLSDTTTGAQIGSVANPGQGWENGRSSLRAQAESCSNCSASDSCRLQAYFACCLRSI
jgi:TolB-like protein